MTPRTLMIAAVAAALFSVGAAESAPNKAPTQAPPPAKSVDLARFYTGTWIEIGRRPMKLTDGCVAGATTYKPVSATRIDVVDTCHADRPTGKLKSLGGPGTILDPGPNTRIKVSYRFLGFIPVDRIYCVLDHDDDYTWFISSDPEFQNLWIYTRDPHVDPAILKGLVEKARALGYDVSKLEFPAQP